MRPSEDCVQLLARLEGFRARPYLCPGGVWTVGFGLRTLADGTRVGPGIPDAISRERAQAELRLAVARVWGSVQGMTRVPLTQGQCDALTLLAYNIGETALRRSTLLRLLNSGDYAGASAQFPRWVKARGRVLSGLVRRRKIERALFDEGIHTT
jgi:lysozyme